MFAEFESDAIVDESAHILRLDDGSIQSCLYKSHHYHLEHLVHHWHSHIESIGIHAISIDYIEHRTNGGGFGFQNFQKMC